MAQAKTTITGRTKLCRAHAGDIALPKILYMGFGNGGVNPDGEVIEATGEEAALKNELLRREIISHTYPVPTTCRYTARLYKGDLPGEFISELGLYDAEGDLIAYTAFLPKGKDADMEFLFDVDEIF